MAGSTSSMLFLAALCMGGPLSGWYALYGGMRGAQDVDVPPQGGAHETHVNKTGPPGAPDDAGNALGLPDADSHENHAETTGPAVPDAGDGPPESASVDTWPSTAWGIVPLLELLAFAALDGYRRTNASAQQARQQLVQRGSAQGDGAADEAEQAVAKASVGNGQTLRESAATTLLEGATNGRLDAALERLTAERARKLRDSAAQVLFEGATSGRLNAAVLRVSSTSREVEPPAAAPAIGQQEESTPPLPEQPAPHTDFGSQRVASPPRLVVQCPYRDYRLTEREASPPPPARGHSQSQQGDRGNNWSRSQGRTNWRTHGSSSYSSRGRKGSGPGWDSNSGPAWSGSSSSGWQGDSGHDWSGSSGQGWGGSSGQSYGGSSGSGWHGGSGQDWKGNSGQHWSGSSGQGGNANQWHHSQGSSLWHEWQGRGAEQSDDRWQ